MRNLLVLNQEVAISSATSVNHHSLLPKPRYKTTNRKQHNKAHKMTNLLNVTESLFNHGIRHYCFVLFIVLFATYMGNSCV